MQVWQIPFVQPNKRVVFTVISLVYVLLKIDNAGDGKLLSHYLERNERLSPVQIVDREAGKSDESHHFDLPNLVLTVSGFHVLSKQLSRLKTMNKSSSFMCLPSENIFFRDTITEEEMESWDRHNGLAVRAEHVLHHHYVTRNQYYFSGYQLG